MFTDYFFPELGGIQDSVATISRSLARRGHQVDIHAPRYASAGLSPDRPAVRERDLGANVRVRRRPSLPVPSSTRQSRAALPSPIGLGGAGGEAKPDVIHVHSFFGIGLEALLGAPASASRWSAPTTRRLPASAPHMPVQRRLGGGLCHVVL